MTLDPNEFEDLEEPTRWRVRLSEWWRIWWDEILIGLGATAIIVAIICGGWYLFQTSPFRLEEGVVQQPIYTAQYTHMHDGGSTCWSRNENGFCTFSTDNPDTEHEHCVGGCFELVVHGCSNDRRGDEHCRDERETVSEFTFNHCNRGQLWVRGESECRPR